MIELRSDWTVDGVTYPQGALLATGFDAFVAGGRAFEVLFTPTPSTSLDGVAATSRARHRAALRCLGHVFARLTTARAVVAAFRSSTKGDES